MCRQVTLRGPRFYQAAQTPILKESLWIYRLQEETVIHISYPLNRGLI